MRPCGEKKVASPPLHMIVGPTGRTLRNASEDTWLCNTFSFGRTRDMKSPRDFVPWQGMRCATLAIQVMESGPQHLYAVVVVHVRRTG